jgi:phytoene desaturase
VIGVTCQSVSEPSCAPPGHTNLFVMTSPPALGDAFAWTPENTAAYRARVLRLLVSRCGFPADWRIASFASRYGRRKPSRIATARSRAACTASRPTAGGRRFLRPPNRAKSVRGLFFVGGGTHPGGGLPLVTLGGKIVADAVVRRGFLKGRATLTEARAGCPFRRVLK